jgi:hypothetical protein
MESKESSGHKDDGGVRDYERQYMSKDKTDNKETLTMSKHLEAL